MRKAFFNATHSLMSEDSRIWVVTGDLGFAGFDKIKEDFPDRFINYQVAEFSMVSTAIGLALSGKIPLVYSIAPFLIYRPFELLRTYLNHERIPVKLIASGRDFDYKTEGISHYGHDVKGFLDLLTNIRQFYPEDTKEIPPILREITSNNSPSFLSLKK